MATRFAFNAALQHKIWVLLHHSCDLATKHADITFNQKTGLSLQQYLALHAIAQFDDPVTAPALAQRLERNTNTMSTILERMEKRGLVKKTKNLPDHRLVRVVLTKKGKDKLVEATKIGWELIEGVMSAFSEEELHTLANMIEKLRKRIYGEIYPGKSPPDIEVKDYQKIVRLLEKA